MKELKAKSRLISRPKIVFSAILIISVYAVSSDILSTSATFAFAFIMAFFNYITSIARFHKFTYDKYRVLISNTWYPFINDEIDINELIKLELTVATNIGNAVVFYFTNGKKKLYGIEARKEDIEEMINFIQAEIEKNN
jgi:hypothetical protein